MKELTLSTQHLENSIGLLAEAVAIETDHFVADTTKAPRVAFADFYTGVAAAAEIHKQGLPEIKNGRFVFKPQDMPLLGGFDGLRGFAQANVTDKDNVLRPVIGPAIVLAGGTELAVLIAEQPGGRITDTQQALLENEYVKARAAVSANHSALDITNAGDIAPALLVASTPVGRNPHGDLHGLAGGRTATDTFGVNFSRSGRQDMYVGHEVRGVRTAVVPLRQAVLHVGKPDQLPTEANLFDLKLSSGELAVAMTIGATDSRGERLDLAANLSSMTDA